MKQLKHWQDPGQRADRGMDDRIALDHELRREPTLSYNATIVGMLLVAVALGATFVPRAWEEWSEAIIGVWMIVSPWACTSPSSATRG
jgi:hypothetical protein